MLTHFNKSFMKRLFSVSAFLFCALFALQAHAASPVVSFTQDVDLGPTASDTIEISATDTDGDITALDYGFSADAICDGTDTYPNPFTHATPFAITSEANNGSYLCVRTTDTSSGINYFISGNTLNIDSTAPAFDTMVISARDAANAFKVAASDGKFYVRESELVRFQVFISPADTWEVGNQTLFTVGGVVKTHPAYLDSATPITSRTRPYTVAAGDNGTVAVTGLTFLDKAGNAITGFAIPTISPEIIVDTVDPVISYTDDVAAGPVTSDDVTITVTDTNTEASTLEYGFSPDAICDGTDTFGNAFTSGVPFTINTEANNGSYICAKAEDKAGNEVFLGSLNPLNIDVTAPVFASIGVTSDNPFDSNYGNATSTLTFTLTLSAADSFAGPGAGTGRITFDIGTTTGITVDLNEAASSTPGSVYTATYALSGENGSINISAIDFQDFVNQNMTGFAAGAPSPTVIIDTTAPSLDSASRVSSNNNPLWARNNDTITYTLGFDEDVRLDTLNSASTATNATRPLVQEFDLPSFGTSDQIIFAVSRPNGDNGPISVSNADFDIVDRAGNTTTIAAGDINALIVGTITADTTRPTVTMVSISSNNALDTTLAKTNDTITVDFVAGDNLSPTYVLRGDRTILNLPFTSTSVGPMGPGSVSRFTDGTEDSEVVVPFSFRIRDEAGNRSRPATTATTDGSSVRFDRTDPVVANVMISATSQDAMAYLGDVPTYYARMGDTIDFQFDLCDYVDSDSNPPTGTFFGTAITMTDGGLIGGACTTGDGNPSTFRRWTHQIVGADGTEGTVTFSIDAKDNAGNVFASVTGTTDGSSVIFDKTLPLSPSTILDLQGAETAQFKHRRNASYTWSGHTDPNTSGADLISDLITADVIFDHPTNGTNETATLPIATTSYTPALPLPSDDPYTFHVTVKDKAGNISSPEKAYTQLYTIGINGKITDTNGQPIAGANIQVSSEFGDTCLVGTDICTGFTDADGVYEVLVRKERDYVVSWWERNHYLEKEFLRVELDDVLRNITLEPITDPHHTQTGSQSITIRTDHTFIAADGEPDTTLLFVVAQSGEVSAIPQGDGFLVTSFSRIHSVTSNNPDVTILMVSGNKYLVTGAGNFGTTHSTGNVESSNNNPPVFSFGASRTFSSGSSRVGVTGNSGSGKTSLRFPGMTREQFQVLNREGMSYGESLQMAHQMNQGFKGRILYYINEHGYRVFRGYVPGRLALDKVGKRYTNHVAYRGGPIRNMARIDVPEENEIPGDEAPTAFEQRFQQIKSQYKNRGITFNPEPEQVGFLKRDSAEDQLATVMNARAQRITNNNSYKFRPRQAPRTKSRITRDKDANNFKVRVGGKTIGVGTMMGR